MKGLSSLREQLMDMKESMLETCVGELKAAIIGMSLYTHTVLYSWVSCVCVFFLMNAIVLYLLVLRGDSVRI